MKNTDRTDIFIDSYLDDYKNIKFKNKDYIYNKIVNRFAENKEKGNETGRIKILRVMCIVAVCSVVLTMTAFADEIGNFIKSFIGERQSAALVETLPKTGAYSDENVIAHNYINDKNTLWLPANDTEEYATLTTEFERKIYDDYDEAKKAIGSEFSLPTIKGEDQNKIFERVELWVTPNGIYDEMADMYFTSEISDDTAGILSVWYVGENATIETMVNTEVGNVNMIKVDEMDVVYTAERSEREHYYAGDNKPTMVNDIVLQWIHGGYLYRLNAYDQNIDNAVNLIRNIDYGF